MNCFIKLLGMVFLLALGGCNKEHSASRPREDGHASPGASKLVAPDGNYLGDAAKDHTSPPYIRESAAVFARVTDGVETDTKAIDRAVNELAATRNEKTCRIWISMMHASEAGLPEVLPSLEEFGKMEKQAREGALTDMESNPLRFIGILVPCVKYLTEFDLPEADREVAEFMRRFESKYGGGDGGMHFLKIYQMEIRDATEVRKTGTPHWKLGRKYLNGPKEY